MGPRREDRHADQGFSLVELLVVVMLVGVVGTIVMSVTVGATRAAARQEDSTRTLIQSKVAMERMTRDIRGADTIEVAEDDVVQVRSSLDGVSRVVRYEVRGDAVGGRDIVRLESRRGPSVSEDVDEKILGGLAIGRSESVFGYLRGDGQKVKDAGLDGSFVLSNAELSDVASVRVVVRVLRKAGPPVQLKQVVSIRNLEG